MKPQIGIILGSDSDFPVLEKAIILLREVGVPFLLEVSSAHRTPERTVRIVRDFERRGVRVLIAVAGGAAHLPGVAAAHTQLPVLGVPANSSLNGLDSLLSIVQMPKGVPVATFGVGEAGGYNAVLFALAVLALTDDGVAEALRRFRREQQAAVVKKSKRLRSKLAKG
jgi:phosphoribosylaminoimidazole carboxylase PurE protein